VVVWGEAAERLKDKLKKGSPVHVEGRLRSEEYEDKTGQKRSALKVVARRVQFLAKMTGSESPGPSPSPAHEEPVDSKTDLEEVPF
jgi:single-strand DNA-binding protein